MKLGEDGAYSHIGYDETGDEMTELLEEVNTEVVNQ